MVLAGVVNWGGASGASDTEGATSEVGLAEAKEISSGGVPIELSGRSLVVAITTD